jgi:hypothetical protein
MKRIVGWLALFAGGVLIGVALLGHYTGLGDYQGAQARDWETFNSVLASELRSWPELVAEADRRTTQLGGDEDVMLALYGLVTERFTHRAARHNLFSNWLLAGIGLLHPAFAHIRDPETMIRRGQSLLCGQSSYLLLRLAREHGIRARHVGLDGHVVMEAWYEDDWHLFDPDLEIVPRDGRGEILSVEKLAQNPALLRGYYGDHQGEQASMVEILGSRENNTYMSYPPGAWFEWKNNVLYWFEKLAAYLKFILPLALVGLGLWVLRNDFRRLAVRRGG